MAFGGPDIPSPQAPPPAPDPRGASAAADEARRKQEQAADIERQARGRSSTILNGGMGDDSKANVSRRTLLGY